jgi:hypothetical protein
MKRRFKWREGQPGPDVIRHAEHPWPADARDGVVTHLDERALDNPSAKLRKTWTTKE